MTVALVSLEEVKATLPVRPGNTEFDERLSKLILQATSQIENATGRELWLADRVEYFSTRRNYEEVYDLYNPANDYGTSYRSRPQRLVLKATAIQGADAVEVRYDPYRVFGDDTVVDPSLYVVDLENSIVTLLAATVETFNGIKVSYFGGYDNDDNHVLTGVPDFLKLACVTQVQFLFTKLAGDNVGQDTDRSKGSVGSGRFTTTAGLTPEVADMVSGLKRTLTGRY